MRSPVSNCLSRIESDDAPAIVLINGNEPLLVEEALDQLRQSCRSAGFTERLTWQLDASFDWGLLSSSGQSMSLFSDKRLLELRVPGKLGVAGSKALSEYCQNPAQDDVLFLIMPLLDKKQRQSAWFKKVSPCAEVIDFYDISDTEFPQWLKQRLQSSALRVENGVIEQMTQQLEGNLLAAAQEVDKLKVLAPDGAVTLALLAECMADHTRFDVFQLIESILANDLHRVRRIIGRLKSEGIEPVIIVWALARECRTLTEIISGLQQGKTRNDLFRQHRIWNKRQAGVNAALDRHSLPSFYELLKQVAILDQSIKGQRQDQPGDIWFQLEKFCMQMCGVKIGTIAA